MNRKSIAIALAVAIALANLPAQEPTAPKFEVISVKLNKSPDPSKALLQLLPGGRLVATNIPLIQVIAVAWNLPPESQRLILAPGVSMPSDIYDIEAAAPAGAFPKAMTQDARLAKMRLMVQALLEDRFKLSVRDQPTEQLVYALVVAKDGPKFQKSRFQEENCGDSSPTWISNPACHFLNGGQDSGLGGESVTLRQVIDSVENYTDRPVLDKTGLTGFWNIQIEAWAPMRPALDGAARRDDASNSDRPSLFDAFEKVGLRMESQRAVVDTFVIYHVERPGEN